MHGISDFVIGRPTHCDVETWFLKYPDVGIGQYLGKDLLSNLTKLGTDYWNTKRRTSSLGSKIQNVVSGSPIFTPFNSQVGTASNHSNVHVTDDFM